MTIETEETVVLRGSPGPRSPLMWCPRCRRQVEMVTPEQGAQIAGVTQRTIYRWIEGETVHFIEDREEAVGRLGWRSEKNKIDLHQGARQQLRKHDLEN